MPDKISDRGVRGSQTSPISKIKTAPDGCCFYFGDPAGIRTLNRLPRFPWTFYGIEVSGVRPNRTVTKKGHPCGYPFFLGDPAGIRTLDAARPVPDLALNRGVRGSQPSKLSKKKAALRLLFRFGDPAGIRTPDTLLKRQVLCRLSYWVVFNFLGATAGKTRCRR